MVISTRYGINSIKSQCIKYWNYLLIKNPTINFQDFIKHKIIKFLKSNLIHSQNLD